MGYNLKMHIVSRLGSGGHDGKWFSPEVTVDLYKVGSASAIKDLSNEYLKKTPGNSTYYYVVGVSSSDMHECDFTEYRIDVDSYGKYFSPCDIDAAINALEEDVKTSEYRRYTLGLVILRKFRDCICDGFVFFEGY